MHVRAEGPVGQPDHPRGYRAPFLGLLCAVGFLSTIIAFFIGFVPPSQFGNDSPVVYVAIVAGGVGIIGLLVPFLLYRLRKPSWKIERDEAPGEEVVA